MSNYPPGVTGLEYAIAGAQHEYETYSHCPACDQERDGMTYGYDSDWWWVCDDCGTQVDVTDDD